MEVLLTWLGWFGDVMAVLGSYFIGSGNRLGWKCFLVADFSLIGLPIYLHAWNLATLYAIFIVLGLRGLYPQWFANLAASIKALCMTTSPATDAPPYRYEPGPNAYPPCAIGPHQGACESTYCFPSEARSV